MEEKLIEKYGEISDYLTNYKYKNKKEFYPVNNLRIERLTLKEYIKAVKDIKELQRYKHCLTMDYNSDDVEVIFGEERVIVTNCGMELDEDDFLFNRYIDWITLRI